MNRSAFRYCLRNVLGCHLLPVESRPWVDTETVEGTGDGSQVTVGRSDPSRPVEVGHSSEDVIREPEVDEHSGDYSTTN